MTGGFGDPGKNVNGKRVIDYCAEKDLCVSNTYIEHKSLHKYTKVARGSVCLEMSMIDLVLMKKDMLCYVQDVMKMRGMR